VVEEGYSARGEIHLLNASTDSPDSTTQLKVLALLLRYADSCNNARWSSETASTPGASQRNLRKHSQIPAVSSCQ